MWRCILSLNVEAFSIGVCNLYHIDMTMWYMEIASCVVSRVDGGVAQRDPNCLHFQRSLSALWLRIADALAPSRLRPCERREEGAPRADVHRVCHLEVPRAEGQLKVALVGLGADRRAA